MNSEYANQTDLKVEANLHTIFNTWISMRLIVVNSLYPVELISSVESKFQVLFEMVQLYSFPIAEVWFCFTSRLSQRQFINQIVDLCCLHKLYAPSVRQQLSRLTKHTASIDPKRPAAFTHRKLTNTCLASVSGELRKSV